METERRSIPSHARITMPHWDNEVTPSPGRAGRANQKPEEQRSRNDVLNYVETICQRHLSLALSLCERKVYVREKLTFRDRDLQFKHRSFPYKSYKSMGPSSFQQHAEA